MFRSLVRDAIEFASIWERDGVTPRRIVRSALVHDGFAVLALNRLRESARRWRIPGVNRAVRLLQLGLYGIDIARDVQLGPGVCFVHTVGNIVGGDARLGARVRVLGNVTIGTNNDRGYPEIGDDVVIGAGARILGPVTIGAGAIIGANAVVLSDVPAGATAVGVPAVVRRAQAPAAAEVDGSRALTAETRTGDTPRDTGNPRRG